MQIKKYEKKKMSQQIKALFLAIYPNDSSIAVRMAYDETISTHVCTKVAVIGNRVIGQANIFLMQNNMNMANLGFHVHPDYQKKGIGEKISKATIKEAKNKGIKVLITRTEVSNIASIRLAQKLGFVEPTKEFLEANKDVIHHKNVKKIKCLVLYL